MIGVPGPVDIITGLLAGGYVTYHGTHFDVDSAKPWDLPDVRVPIGVAVSGEQSVQTFATLADVMIATEPDPGPVPAWDAARVRAHEQFRWFAGDDVAAVVDAVRPFAEAGFTDVALVQIGGDAQDSFFAAAEQELLPAFQEAFGEHRTPTPA